MWHPSVRKFDMACALAVLTILAVPVASAQVGKPVLVMFREKSNDAGFFAEKEWGPMAAKMTREGIPFRVVSVEGRTLGSADHPIAVDVALADAVVTDYSALLIPCYGAGDFAMDARLLKLVADCHAQGLLVGAQHSLEALYQVGFSDGYRMAFRPGVVVDRDLVTSFNCPLTALANTKPIDTDEFMTAFLGVLRSRQP